MSIKTSISFKLSPFSVPGQVYESNEPVSKAIPLISSTVPYVPYVPASATSRNRAFDLSELSVKTLNDMCKEFKSEVFKKAGKPEPK